MCFDCFKEPNTQGRSSRQFQQVQQPSAESRLHRPQQARAQVSRTSQAANQIPDTEGDPAQAQSRIPQPPDSGQIVARTSETPTRIPKPPGTGAAASSSPPTQTWVARTKGGGEARHRTTRTSSDISEPQDSAAQASTSRAAQKLVSRPEVPTPLPARRFGLRFPGVKPPPSPFATTHDPPFPVDQSMTPTLQQGNTLGLELRQSESIPMERIHPGLLSSKLSEVSSHGEPDSPSKGRGKHAKVPKNSIGIGIETEFLLQARDPNTRFWNAKKFSAFLAQNHNREVPSSYPQMHSVVGLVMPQRFRDNFDAWTLLDDPTVGTSSAPCESLLLG
jgi:hypothetical protein